MKATTVDIISVKQDIAGYVFNVKINDFEYDSVNIKSGLKFMNRVWVVLRCKQNKVLNYGGFQCRFKMKLKNISGVTEEENPETYWEMNNWKIILVVGKIKDQNAFVL